MRETARALREGRPVELPMVLVEHLARCVCWHDVPKAMLWCRAAHGALREAASARRRSGTLLCETTRWPWRLYPSPSPRDS